MNQLIIEYCNPTTSPARKGAITKKLKADPDEFRRWFGQQSHSEEQKLLQIPAFKSILG